MTPQAAPIPAFLYEASALKNRKGQHRLTGTLDVTKKGDTCFLISEPPPSSPASSSLFPGDIKFKRKIHRLPPMLTTRSNGSHNKKPQAPLMEEIPSLFASPDLRLKPWLVLSRGHQLGRSHLSRRGGGRVSTLD